MFERPIDRLSGKPRPSDPAAGALSAPTVDAAARAVPVRCSRPAVALDVVRAFVDTAARARVGVEVPTKSSVTPSRLASRSCTISWSRRRWARTPIRIDLNAPAPGARS